MGIIKELDYNTIVKIAAGEVIDRPASVVRELIDNSIDAGADMIRVILENGGKTYIEVQDNGRGMDAADLTLSVQDHCTSKIQIFDDIARVSTLGFRGEALSSIAEVADITLRSSTGQGVGGQELNVRFGRRDEPRSCAVNQGTTVIVRDLFKELPARAKFLGQESTETRYIDKEIIKKALAYPRVSFELKTGGKRKYYTSSKNTYVERISDFYPDAVPYFIPLEFISEHFSVQGFLTQPAFLRPNRMYQYFFVNGRAVEWKALSFILQNTYGSLIPRGSFPAVFLYLEIDPERVDFNVHPMKKEVRFREEQLLSREIQHILIDHLHADSGISEAEDSVLRFTPYESRVASALQDYARREEHTHSTEPLFAPHLQPAGSFPGSAVPVPPSPQQSGGYEQRSELLEYKFRGVIFYTYILLEGPGRLVFVDQHAAHERINYEKIKSRYRGEGFGSQELLVPVRVEVPVEIVTDFEENLPTLDAMGFSLEAFGGNTFIIQSIPEYIDYEDAGDVVMGFIQSLQENRDGDAHSSDFIESAMKQMSCKSSIRAGDSIQENEARALLKNLLECDEPFSCPHGRPVMFSLPRYDIERQFKRHGF